MASLEYIPIWGVMMTFSRVRSRVVLCHGLLLGYVQSSTCDMAGFYCLVQVMLVDDTASCGIDDVSALFHGSHLFCGDHVSGLICQRQMHGDDVCIFDDLIDRSKG